MSNVATTNKSQARIWNQSLNNNLCAFVQTALNAAVDKVIGNNDKHDTKLVLVDLNRSLYMVRPTVRSGACQERRFVPSGPIPISEWWQQ